MQCGGIYSVVGHAKIPALKIDTGELFAGCEKLDLVCIFMVGAVRFELTTLCSQSRSDRLLNPVEIE